MPPFDVIAFDADDTLWHNETLFTMTQDKFAALLAPYHDDAWIRQKLYETEIRNLAYYGYGVKGFTLSMIETAIELSEGRISGSELKNLLDEAKRMLSAAVEPLPEVLPVVKTLAADYPLMLITKGDLFDQESKLARSGLGIYFQMVEVVSQKDVPTYRALFARYDLEPSRVLMVGNSIKSDVLPVLACGANAVHVPYQTTWAHEQVSEEELESNRFPVLGNINELPALVENWREPQPQY